MSENRKSATTCDAVGLPVEREVRPLTPLQARIVAALGKMPGRRADWYDLGRMLWPMDAHPKAWNYSSNGGPPGWAMSLSRAVNQLQRAGLVHDDWKSAGVRSVRLLRPNAEASPPSCREQRPDETSKGRAA